MSIYFRGLSLAVLAMLPAIAQDSIQQDSIESKETKVQKLNAVTTTAKAQSQIYNSTQNISRQILESSPNGNGDISSILKILPNVQINNASRTSNAPGEINPANISISGGLPYQNSFQIDGFNMNNDLDPAGSSTNTQPRQRGGQSQGLNIDTSLLDSITIQDSNISAAFGRFSGGVIEANVRKPRKILMESRELFGENGLYGWHFNTSYQVTANELTQYHIPSGQEAIFESSSNENYQPNFIKHAFRANIEGYITQNLGLIASYNTRRSYIPLQVYNNGTSTQKQDQHRIADNYYIKLNYDALENLSFDFSFAYMPSDNSYFTPNFKNSRYIMQGGGILSGLKSQWQSNLGLWTNSLSYSRLENSRKSDVNYYTMINGAEGQFGSVDQIQDDVNFKSDFTFEPLNLKIFKQTFRAGFELIYNQAIRNRIEDSHMYIYGGGPVAIPQGQTWNGQADSFGFISANATRYYNTMGIIHAHKGEFNTFTYGIYLEDDSNLDLGKFGNLNARLGLRLDGDNYLNKHKIAPRFSLSYITPFSESYKTTFTFGANRYYARNLLAYRFYADAVNNRRAYYRTGPNEAWQHCEAGITQCANMSDGVVRGDSTRLSDLDVPYDDELMGSIIQNLGIFTLNLKYIHREGKNQVMQENRGTASAPQYFWSNNGYTKSNIFILSLKNATPLDTFGIKHFYMFSIDYIDSARNYSAYSADIDMQEQVFYNGEASTYANMPAQKINEPLTARLSTTHIFNISRYKFVWNNFFRFKGSYERIVLENYNPNGNQIQRYVNKTFKPTFMWDMRLGFEVDIWRKNTLYVNFDIYNVLNLKNEIALSAADGFYMYNVPSQMAITMNELGVQLWAQVGYKF